MSQDNKGVFRTFANAMGFGGELKDAEAAPEKSEREKKLEAQAADNFVALAAGKIVPAAREPLKELYLSAMSAGCEDKVDALVKAMPNLNLTGQVMEVLPGSSYAVAEPGTDEDEELKQAREDAKSFAHTDNAQTTE